jgi:hypothetical protein
MDSDPRDPFAPALLALVVFAAAYTDDSTTNTSKHESATSTGATTAKNRCH